ncbi:MAG: hypothetical protein ACXWK9_11460, partial [Myxococcaceae bacterium]
VDLAVELGREIQSPTFVGAIAQQLYAAVSGLGHGRSDYSAVSTLYQDAAGITVATGRARATREEGEQR